LPRAPSPPRPPLPPRPPFHLTFPQELEQSNKMNKITSQNERELDVQ
jgi:hypothetical protein